MKYALFRDFPLLERALASRGWKRTFDDDWNLAWSWCTPDHASSASGRRRSNHFPGSRPMHRKDLQADLLRCTPAHNFSGIPGVLAPATFVLPGDADTLQSAATRSPHITWIAKPIDGSCGRGIRLIGPGEPLPLQEECIVQQYLDQPHLIDGHRYTLRIWIALISLDPFVVYICRDGLVKRAAHAYVPGMHTLDDAVMHLTNSDVQKHSEDGLMPLLSLEDFTQILRDEGRDEAAFWNALRVTCARTVLRSRQTLLNALHEAPEDEPPFELFGFDIVVDSELRPWVIELNRNPDMRAVWGEGGPEAGIKEKVLGDLIDLLFPSLHADPYPYDRGSWQLLFPHPQAGDWKEDWMPTEHDRDVFRSHGIVPPTVSSHHLLHNAHFVDDGSILFSPYLGEFLAMNDSATMIALNNDEGQPATRDTAPLLHHIWRYAAFIHRETPAPQLAHTVPLHHTQQHETCFRIADILVRCSVPQVSDQLRDLLQEVAPCEDNADTVYVVTLKGHIRILSRLGSRSSRDTLAVGMIFETATMLLCNRPANAASISGTAIALGDTATILCGSPFRGKTTLATALILRGAQFLSDVSVQIDTHGNALPLPMPLLLRGDARILLDEWFQQYPGRISQQTHHSHDAELLFPLAVAAPLPVGNIMHVHLRPGEPTTLTPLGVCDLLQRLQSSCLNMAEQPTQQDGHAFLNTLTKARRYELVIGSLHEAVDLILQAQ